MRELFDARELPLAVMLDSVGSAAVESLAEYVNDLLCQAGSPRAPVTNRISPGYAGWDTAEQRALFRLCAGEPIGVTLNEACFMTPGKTISLLVGDRARGARGSLLHPVPPLLDARLRVPPRARRRHGAAVTPLPWSPSAASSWPCRGLGAHPDLAALDGPSHRGHPRRRHPARRPLGRSRRIPRLVTVIGVYAGFALVIAVLGRFLVPALTEQTKEFVEQLPAHLENARGLMRRLLAWVARWDLPLPAPTAGGDGLQKVGQVLLENTLRATAGVLGAVVGFFLVLVLAAYLVMDARRHRALSRAPAARRPARPPTHGPRASSP